MTASNIGLLHEIDVHVLYPSQRCDCVRVIAETRAEAVEAAKLELEVFEGCMFLPLFVHGPTNLATA
jgi:hypothetical protein